MTADERAALIDRYRRGADVVEEVALSMSDEQLDRRPEDGTWTAREAIHHLADAEMTSAIRLRRLLAEDHPTIVGYDEAEFARRLAYSERPIHRALAAIRAARESSLELLERLTEEQWGRTGTHTESGEYGVEIWLRYYAEHPHDHAAQMRRASGA